MISFLCVPQINKEDITTPRTIVSPTKPGNLAPASGKKINSVGPIFSTRAGSIFTSPTANTNASETKCPSTFDKTLLVTVYVPSVNGENILYLCCQSGRHYYQKLLDH
jgi:hypothetical protein